MLASSLLTNQRDGFCGFVWSRSLGQLGTLCLVPFFFAHNYQREHFIPLSWVGTVTLFMGSELKFDFVIAWCSGFICVVYLLYYFALSHLLYNNPQVLLLLMAFAPFVASSSFPVSAPGIVVPLFQPTPRKSFINSFTPYLSAHLVPFPMSSAVSPLLVPTPTW